MSKKQTYISYLEDKNGKMIDFERWAYKKHITVLKKATELYKEMNTRDWYREGTLSKAEYFTIYSTPDGYNKEKNPIIKISITELLN